MKSVIVTSAEAYEGVLGGMGPYHFLQKKFRDEHGLEFTVEELQDETKFKYDRDELERAYRITYLGGLNEKGS
jgi:hypothetical protein